MTAQTAMAAAFVRAGVNAHEARLRQIVAAALKKHHRNIPRALDTVERQVEDDPDLIREALLKVICLFDHEISGNDLALNGGNAPRVDVVAGETNVDGRGQQRTASQGCDAGPSSSHRAGAGHGSLATQIKNARPGREPTAVDRLAAAAVAKSIAITVLDSRKTSDGRAWGDVGAHELDGMDRDGAIARVVKSKLGVLTNEDRFRTVRELMSPAAFEAALKEASHAS